MSPVRGFFAAIDGPSGVGKTTIVRRLAHLLSSQGYPVFATREPTDTPLGNLVRFGTDDYPGITLACLVTADRYQHLDHEIRPALSAGKVVLSDRYLASTLVLQRLDAVPNGYLWLLNQYADPPDLYVFLGGDVSRARERAARRGVYSRFHRGGREAGIAEAAMYASVANELARRGYKVVVHDSAVETADQVVQSIAAVILNEWSPQTDGA
jgi:dTMP kinase